MDITPETKIHALLEEYPYLLDYLAEYHTEFQKLKNPVLRATLTRVASLETAAEMADVPISKLIADLTTEVDRREGRAPDDAGVGTTSAEPAHPGPVGEERRQEILKGIIRDLHAGADREEIKNRFAELVQEVEPGEIAQMEQALIAEGMPAEEIQGLCDVHVSVFKDSLDAGPAATPPLPPGHPVDTFLRENRMVAERTAALHCREDELAAVEEAARGAVLRQIAEELDDLAEIETHYLRKENQLFPVLEHHGVTGPTQVMWGIHDEIRALRKGVARAAEDGRADEVSERLPELLSQIEDMVYKEEKILFPVSLERLGPEEWERVRAGEEDIGYAWLQPDDVPHPTLDALDHVGRGGPVGGRRSGAPEGGAGAVGPSLVPLTTGAIPLDRIDWLLRLLPFDLTYVDENDEVRYYSEGERVFARSPAVIGRNVAHRHPPKSVDAVKRIVEEFRAGTKDLAEFWIQLEGRFVHIRYFAVRDSDGAYRGVLEVVQDITRQRELEGQRRLLDW